MELYSASKKSSFEPHNPTGVSGAPGGEGRRVSVHPHQRVVGGADRPQAQPVAARRRQLGRYKRLLPPGWNKTAI